MNIIYKEYKKYIVGAIAAFMLSGTGIIATGAINWIKYPFTNAVTDSIQGELIKQNAVSIKKCATKKDQQRFDSVYIIKLEEISNKIESDSRKMEEITKLIYKVYGKVEVIYGNIKYPPSFFDIGSKKDTVQPAITENY